MDEIDKIIGEMSPDEAIAYLTDKTIDVRPWEASLKEYEPDLHRIVNDHVDRKDKVKDDGSVEKAARIAIGLEQLLTKRMCVRISHVQWRPYTSTLASIRRTSIER